ncbi:MAG: tyrosine-type recombinase/integrase [Angustibacter sp.]
MRRGYGLACVAERGSPTGWAYIRYGRGRTALGRLRRDGGEQGRVFVRALGHTLQRSSFVWLWKAVKQAAGIHAAVHFHDLRHTSNHLAAESGVTTRNLMARMGHASMRATLIFQHATNGGDRRIAASLGAPTPSGNMS